MGYISLLGQVCITDLRVDVAPFIYCTDASLQGGRICVVEETQSVVAELWRHSEQRDYSTQLLNPAASVLAELGLEHVDPLPEISDPQVIDNLVRVPVSLREGYVFDTLELFRGEGNWTLAHKELGMHVHGGVDVRGHQVAFEDMLDDSVFHELLSLALRHAVRDWHTLSALRTAFLMHIVTSWVIMSVLSNLAHLSCFILMSSNVWSTKVVSLRWWIFVCLDLRSKSRRNGYTTSHGYLTLIWNVDALPRMTTLSLRGRLPVLQFWSSSENAALLPDVFTVGARVLENQCPSLVFPIPVACVVEWLLV